MRTVVTLSLVCTAVGLALAAYCVTRVPIYKHVTSSVLEHIDRTYINRASLNEDQIKKLDRQFEIVLYNEAVKEQAWSSLWSVAPLGFLFLAVANAALAFLSYRMFRPRGVSQRVHGASS